MYFLYIFKYGNIDINIGVMCIGEKINKYLDINIKPFIHTNIFIIYKYKNDYTYILICKNIKMHI